MTTEEIDTAFENATDAELRETEEGFKLYIAKPEIFKGTMNFYGWVDEEDAEEVQERIKDMKEEN